MTSGWMGINNMGFHLMIGKNKIPLQRNLALV